VDPLLPLRLVACVGPWSAARKNPAAPSAPSFCSALQAVSSLLVDDYSVFNRDTSCYSRLRSLGWGFGGVALLLLAVICTPLS